MTAEHERDRQDKLFALLDPPRGGEARLRARLAAAGAKPFARPTAVWPSAAAVSALAMLTLVAVLVDYPARRTPGLDAPTSPQSVPSTPVSSNDVETTAAPNTEQRGSNLLASPALDGLLGRAPAAPPPTVRIDDRPVETEELRSTDPRVRIYRLR
jgi:hypothetical protein